jgi:hypothetical protein
MKNGTHRHCNNECVAGLPADQLLVVANLAVSGQLNSHTIGSVNSFWNFWDDAQSDHEQRQPQASYNP